MKNARACRNGCGESFVPPGEPARYRYLYSHGIADDRCQAVRYKDLVPCGQPFLTFDYPDATPHFWRVAFWRADMGQASDVTVLRKQYQALVNTESTPIVIIGLSRGASTALIALGRQELPHVSALIAESPYDSMTAVVQGILHQICLDRVPGSMKLGQVLTRGIFWRYRPDGLTARTHIENLPRTLPVLMVYSVDDRLVPPHSTLALYNALRATGHNHVHLLKIRGRHGFLIDGVDGHTYRAAVHAFYRAYGLPYNPHAAALGERWFMQESQPSEVNGLARATNESVSCWSIFAFGCVLALALGWVLFCIRRR